MDLPCLFCQKTLTKSGSSDNYYTCRECRLIFPQAQYPQNCPTKYAIQLFPESKDILKETIVLLDYVIDYRTYIGAQGETTIGQYFWDDRFNVVNYRQVTKINGRAFDVSNLEQAQQKLRVLLTFS